jgi:tetratricopeptide (TPR) repeat protein
LLEDLRAALGSGENVALTQTQAITGLGGIGKTQLALEYSYRYRDDYDIVWWVRSELTSQLAEDYARLAAELDLPEKALKVNEAAAAVRNYLQNHSRRLLVFDNVQDPNDVKDYLPRGGGGHTILTSRNTDWGSLARTLTVSKFDRAESIEFLFKRTGQTDKEAADNLAAALGDLPLALEQAGAYMKRTGRSLKDFLKAYKEKELEVLKRKEGKPSDYPSTVAATWELSFQKVQEESEVGAGLLRLFSYLAPDGIPSTLLTQSPGQLPASIAAVKDEPIFDQAVAALKHYSLVGYDDGKFSVHRLVQAVTRDRLTENKQKEWAKVAVELINKAFPKVQSSHEEFHGFLKHHLDKPKSWPECSLLLPHALTASEHAEKLGVAPEATSRLLNKSDLYMRTSGKLRDARSAIERALKIDEAVYGPGHPNVAIDFNNLGGVLHDMSELWEARNCFERALKIDEAVYGPDHPNVAIDFNNLGGVLHDMSEFREARNCFERALKIDEAVYGTVLNNSPIVSNRSYC